MLTTSQIDIFFYRACKAQGLDRKSFPYYGYGQPYCAYIGAVWMTLIVIFFGYSSFTPWSTDTFFSNYVMCGVAPVLFVFWKVFKRTKFVKPHEADLVWERPIIDAYESTFTSKPVGFWAEVLQLVGIGRHRKDIRRDSI